MNLRFHLVRTKASAVLCVGCGRFGADHVIMLADGSETEYGCHRKCLPRLHVKRVRKVVDHAAE